MRHQQQFPVGCIMINIKNQFDLKTKTLTQLEIKFDELKL